MPQLQARLAPVPVQSSMQRMLRLMPRLPILARELVEISARRRTYVLRVVLLLLILQVWNAASTQVSISGTLSYAYQLSYRGVMPGQIAPLGSIGHGMELIMPVLIMVLIAAMCLLPTLSTLSLTQEREQGTLVLLLLTPLPPGSLLLQKFLSLLIWGGSLLLLSLPLLAISYANGGIDGTLLGSLLGMSVEFMVQTAALGLAIGSWIRRPLLAIILANLSVLALHLGAILFAEWFRQGHPALVFQAASLQRSADVLPTWVFLSPAMLPQGVAGGRALDASALPLLLTAVLLIIARIGINRHPESGGEGGLHRLFLGLDRLWERFDARWFRRSSQRDLPQARPVFWLELNRRALCNLRYLARILLPVAALAIYVTLASLHEDGSFHPHGQRRYSEIFSLALGIGCLVQAMLASGILARERSDQTLEVLLTTSISPATILRHKMRALSRIRWGVSACLLLMVFVQAFTRSDIGMYPVRWLSDPSIMLQAALAILLPGVCSWFGALIGLYVQQQRRAALIALAGVVVWMAGTMLVLDVPTMFNFNNASSWYYFAERAIHPDFTTQAAEVLRLLLCPLRGLVDLDGSGPNVHLDTSQIVVAGLLLLMLWTLLRSLCLGFAQGRIRSSKPHDR